MILDSALALEFAKATDDSSVQSSEYTSYGEISVSTTGKVFVTLDGSTVAIPVDISMGAEDGDRVLCTVKDHRVIVTGNITHPADSVQSEKVVQTIELTAQNAAIGSLIATDADFTKLTANSAFVKKLFASEVSGDLIKAETADIGFLTVDILVAEDSDFNKLTADSAFVKRLFTDAVSAQLIKTNLIEADTGVLHYLSVDQLAADYLSAKEIESEEGNFHYLAADVLDAKYASVRYIEADNAYIISALIGDEMVNLSLIKDAVISEGKITGFLDAVKINADNITAGTLTVDRLLIRDEEGNYKLATYNEAGELVVTTIDGSVITEKTITADHIVAHTITSNELTVENITGAHGWINLAEGTFNYGGQIKWDGINLFINPQTLYSLIGDDQYASVADFNDIKNQIEGSIGVYHIDHIPTLTNYPTITWTFNIPVNDTVHLADDLKFVYDLYFSRFSGSIAYNRANNKSYKFVQDKKTKEWGWIELEDGEYGTIISRLSNVEIDMDGISSEVKQVQANLEENYSDNTALGTLFKQSAESIMLAVEEGYVGQEKIIASINASKEGVNITGDKINLQGTVTANEYFKVNADGSMEAKGGTIGGWTIDEKKMYAGTSEYGVAVVQRPGTDMTWVFAAGGKSHDNYSDCPFRVSKSGAAYASNLTVTGGTISGANATFNKAFGVSSPMTQYGTDVLANISSDSNGFNVGIFSMEGWSGITSLMGSRGPEVDIEAISYLNIHSAYGGITLLAGGNGTHINGGLWVDNVQVTGAKSRVVDTETYDSRALYCYEMPSPMFGDLGEGIIDDSGKCYIQIDDILSETIDTGVKYQVFLQKYGAGDCWVSIRESSYFVVEGTPNLSFGWELKAIQRDFDSTRLEVVEEYREGDIPSDNLAEFLLDQLLADEERKLEEYEQY